MPRRFQGLMGVKKNETTLATRKRIKEHVWGRHKKKGCGLHLFFYVCRWQASSKKRKRVSQVRRARNKTIRIKNDCYI